MQHNFLIACDSFKGSLSSLEIGDMFQSIIPNIEVVAISDGGEGFVASILFNIKASQLRKIKTVDDMGHEIFIKIAVKADTAYFDVASIVALNNYPQISGASKTTKGIGIVINELEKDPTIKNVVIGLGGSSTSDLGFYAALEIGFKFLDMNNQPIIKIEKCAKIVKVVRPKLKNSYTGLSDVVNPLLGPKGSLNIFAHQKHFSSQEVDLYHTYFKKLSSVLGKSHVATPGAGAAGGLGYFILNNLSGILKSGIKEMIAISNLKDKIKNTKYLITGEGKFDDQSFFGKAPYEIAKLASKKKAILVAGIIDANSDQVNAMFLDHFQLKKAQQNVDEAILESKNNLRDVVLKIKNKYWETI